jgi:hypothetical protein
VPGAPPSGYCYIGGLSLLLRKSFILTLIIQLIILLAQIKNIIKLNQLKIKNTMSNSFGG